jgi:site-specific recombinase XerD
MPSVQEKELMTLALGMTYLEKVAGGYEGRNPKRYEVMPPIRTLSEAVAFCEGIWSRNYPDSLSTYSRHVREFVQWAHQHLEHPCLLHRIDHHVLARYRWWLENRPARDGGYLKGASIQLKLNSIAAMYKVLVNFGYVECSPLGRIENGRTRRRRLEGSPFEELRLTTENLRRLLAYPFENEGYWGLRDKVLLHTLGFLGMRPVELSWMCPSNLIGNTLTFQRAKHNYPGSFWMPDEYREWVDEMQYQYGILPHQPMFLSQYRTRITVRGIQNIVRKYAEKIGVPGLTPKDFRSTVETYMDEHFDELHRDKFMGYVPSDTARKYYVKVPKSRVQEMFDAWVKELKG